MFSKLRNMGLGRMMAVLAFLGLVALFAAPAQAATSGSSHAGTTHTSAVTPSLDDNNGTEDDCDAEDVREGEPGCTAVGVPKAVQGGLASLDREEDCDAEDVAEGECTQVGVPKAVQGGLASFDKGERCDAEDVREGDPGCHKVGDIETGGVPKAVQGGLASFDKGERCDAEDVREGDPGCHKVGDIETGGVPKAVQGGLVSADQGSSSLTGWATLLVGMGAGLMIAGGWMRLGSRRRNESLS